MPARSGKGKSVRLALVLLAAWVVSNPVVRPAAAARQEPALGAWSLRLAAPISTWDEAVPLGNGLTGGLLWGDNGTLRLSLDRGDLWDLRTPEIYKESDWNYATIRRLVAERNQAELVRRFDAPFEEIPYPTKLPGARLEMTLDDGKRLETFDLDLKQAVGRASFEGGDVTAFFSAIEPVAMLRVSGSRARLRLVAPASLSKLGYAPARTGETASSAWLEQEAALGLSYAVNVESRTVGAVTEIAVSVTTSRDGARPLALARSRTRSALARGFASLLGPHTAWWTRFWSTSWVQVPDGSAQRHYNLVQVLLRCLVAPRCAANAAAGRVDGRCGRFAAVEGRLPLRPQRAAQLLGVPAGGAIRRGPQLSGLHVGPRACAPRVRTPLLRDEGHRGARRHGPGWPAARRLGQYSLSPVQGAWVAQAFYLHWRYTMDFGFLATRAYPYCRMVAEGLEGLLKTGDRGTLVLPLSSSPEIHDNTLKAWMAPLTNYDLALIRGLFGWLAEMARAQGMTSDERRWSGLLARMDPLAVDPAGEGLLVSRTEPLAESHRHHSHVMAIHPLGLLTVEGGEGDRATVLASLDRVQRLGTRAWVGYSFSWAACLEARAGRADAALRYLRAYLDAFILRNGFHANGDQTKSGLSNFTYRPFTLEGNFAAAQAVHEMLLQSWGAILRVFPAVPASWADASFRDLRAEGGFVVSAARRGGTTREVSVRATRGASGSAARGASIRIRDPFAQGTGRWTIKRAGDDCGDDSASGARRRRPAGVPPGGRGRANGAGRGALTAASASALAVKSRNQENQQINQQVVKSRHQQMIQRLRQCLP